MPVGWVGVALVTLPIVLAQQQQPQQMPIIPQDPATADRGRGPTGWEQAPSPRGVPANAADSQGTAKGHPTTGSGPSADSTLAPVGSAMPGPSGIAPGEPKR